MYVTSSFILTNSLLDFMLFLEMLQKFILIPGNIIVPRSNVRLGKTTPKCKNSLRAPISAASGHDLQRNAISLISEERISAFFHHLNLFPCERLYRRIFVVSPL